MNQSFNKTNNVILYGNEYDISFQQLISDIKIWYLKNLDNSEYENKNYERGKLHYDKRRTQSMFCFFVIEFEDEETKNFFKLIFNKRCEHHYKENLLHESGYLF